MTEPCIEYSGCTEEETSQQHLEGSCSLLGQRQEQSAVAMSPTAGTDTMDAHADDLMLSELLISLQGSPVAADYSAGAMEASCTTAPAGAGHHHQQQHRGSGRRTAAGAGVSAKASAAGRRTVVHRRKRRDDLAGPCNHCGALTSPQWRKGPKGKPVLCNACGIRFLRNRTLTKAMPKKRRHGMAGGKRSRIAAAMATEGEDEDDFPEHSMAAGDDDMGEAYSAAVSAAAAAAAQAYAAALHPLMMQAGLLPGSSGELYTPQDGAAAAEPAAAPAEPSAVVEGAAAAAPAAASPFQAAAAGKALAAAAAAAPAVSALSHDSLFSSRSNSSSRNLLVQLGDCPSLTLALALHQQQQQRRQQEEQEAEEEMQQQSSKYRLPNFPELQLQPPSSPPADSSGVTGFVCSPPRTSAAGTPAVPAASSPVCSSDSLLQLQHQYSSTTPPLSPLFLGAAGTAAPAAAAAAAAGQGSTGDMVQLVQQLGVALGGVGPAIEFLKLCSGNPAALAAAVAAVAASAAVSAK